MKDYVAQDKAERLEKIKEKALRMVIQFAEGDKEMDKSSADEIAAEYANLSAKYPRFSEVWFLDNIIPLHCKVISISTNYYGHAFYKIAELTGTTVRAGEWINEDLLFPSREALVEKLKETLDITAKKPGKTTAEKLNDCVEFNERFCEVLRGLVDEWNKANAKGEAYNNILHKYSEDIIRLAVEYIEL